MISEELKLEPVNDSINPPPPRFGMPWWMVLGIIGISAVLFTIRPTRILGVLLAPSALGFGWWLVRDDPKELWLLIHDLSLPAEFDPGK
jgi:hypothetical protein